MAKRAPAPDVVARLFDDAWQRWEFAGSVMARQISGESPAEARRILAVPARQVIATPLWIDGNDATLAPETVKLELEVRGLLPRTQGIAGTAMRLLPGEGRTLAVVAVFPAELPGDFPEADVFEVSPYLLALPPDAATIWREGEDLVVAFTRGEDVVYWETIDRTVGAEELRGWLGVLGLRLRAEGVIARQPRIASWVEGLSAAGIAPEGCAVASEGAASSPGVPSLQNARFDWKPASAVLAMARRVRNRQIRKVVLAVAAVYIVMAAGLAIYFGSLRWQMSRLASETARLRAEVETFQPIARDWNVLAPTLTPAVYPLEILGGAVAGMPAKGVRLILFRVEDGKITVSGEADTFQMATDYFNTLSGSVAFRGFDLQSDTPQMKANNSASFNISGSIPTP